MKTMKRVIISSIITIVLVMSGSALFGIMCGNYTDGAYGGGATGEGNTGNSGTASTSDIDQIRFLVIKGAGYFLTSQSKMQEFFKYIELSEIYGPNYEKFLITLNTAIWSMENAKAVYRALIYVAEATPYNQEVIDKLKFFDYDAYIEDKRLNPVIFSEVKSYLSNGDVTGIYKKFYDNTVIILDKLDVIKQRIDGNIFPEKTALWEVNNLYFDNQLFGQYATQVFYSIK
jgi:hypothetical protein